MSESSAGRWVSDQQAGYVCQVHVTDSQAAVLSTACQRALLEAETTIPDDAPQKAGLVDALMQLRDFFQGVALRPQDYPPSGAMARTLKQRKRRQKPQRSTKHRANLQKMQAEREKRHESAMEQAAEGVCDLIERGEFA